MPNYSRINPKINSLKQVTELLKASGAPDSWVGLLQSKTEASSFYWDTGVELLPADKTFLNNFSDVDRFAYFTQV